MQSNILAQVEHLLKDQKFDIDVDLLIGFFKMVKYKWIYPDAVQRFTKASIVEIYNVLDFLANKGYLEQNLEVYCPNCNRYIGQHYKTIFELPEEVYCPHNDCIINNVAQNAVIIYRVLEHE